MFIIKYFNEAYEEYLNGIDVTIFINKFIDKSIKEINPKKIVYYSLSNNFIINSRKLEFNNKIVGYFISNFIEILTVEEEDKYNLFLTYLTILLYNSQNIIININDSNFIKNSMNSLDSNILITNDDYIILYLNDIAKLFLKNINSADNYINLSIFTLLPYLKSFLLDKQNKIMKNKKIKLNIMSKKILIKINSFEYCNSYYNLFIFETLLDDTNNNSMAFLSHELRNPLQTITLASSLLINNLEENKFRKYIEMIKKSSDNMKKIINDILDLNKLKENEMNLDITNVNIKQFLEEMLEEFKQDINKNYSLNYKIQKEVPDNLFTDILRLKQILVNLIGNAIKYSKKNQDNSILVTIKYLDNFIYFEVSDTGIGIKQTDIDKIFECYGQSSDSCDRIDSNGLGLYISQKLANLLGGEISINSIYGMGSTFTLSHPLKLGNSFNIKNIFNPMINLNKNILIVDDMESNALLLKIILQNLSIKYNSKININLCSSGDKAIELTKLNSYDIIFMDINMEILDGYSTTKIIRNNGYTNIIIATTGDETTTIKKNNFVYFDEILIKPFDETNIINILLKFN
jgi:signal transduction histidine kinase